MTARAILAAGGMVAAMAVIVPAQTTPAGAPPVLVLDTAKGAIEIELYPADAPKSVAHILALARRDFYRGLRFHYVQAGSIIQFGDPLTKDMTRRDSFGKGNSGSPIGVLEASKRPWVRGTVGVAYLYDDPTNADSQLFINLVANSNLTGKYTMIGHVTKGMEVADKIALYDVVRGLTVKAPPPGSK